MRDNWEWGRSGKGVAIKHPAPPVGSEQIAEFERAMDRRERLLPVNPNLYVSPPKKKKKKKDPCPYSRWSF